MFNDFSKSTLANGSGTTELELCKDTVTDTERAAFACKTVLVTGANSGLGFDCCKQLAECGWGRIILACRNKERGEDAMKELETKAGKQIFELIVLDVESKMACVEAAKNLSGVLDCLVLNAGKMLPQSEALKPSPDGYTRNSAVHTLGPIVLIDAMLSFNKLNPDATVIYVSAEAARGIKVFGCAPASLPADKSEIDKFVDGKRRCEDGGNWDGFAEYATAKLLATMWISALARKHPQLRTFSVSPGSTRGTCFISELGMLSYVAPIMMNAISVLGLSQPLEHGTDRYVQLANRPTSFQSGSFFASVSDNPVGPIGPQAHFHPILEDEAKQEMVFHALEIHARANAGI
mmetsp:Transcript_36892/g.86842  ORF Transcript_36892/g.86842 Transcript_36892/m.86842 type:complete len:349 (-) Transcript_36892:300-1346(-)